MAGGAPELGAKGLVACGALVANAPDGWKAGALGLMMGLAEAGVATSAFTVKPTGDCGATAELILENLDLWRWDDGRTPARLRDEE
jgi:hypothetical protein